MAHELNYSRFDRLLHRVAFAAPFIQLTAADIEHAMYSASYKSVRATRPIFVTSLPRAGTTVLLDALSQFPSLASHTYRDMPFVLAPILWSRMSRQFQRPHQLKERAHADGVEVGFDSPEAFEEILWRTFWPKKYTKSGIALWRADDATEEARVFFVDHMKKIVALRRPDRVADGRYVSKNNANLARLVVLGRMFPEVTLLVPVRHPLEHAASLLRQHVRFLEMQKAEPFVGRYMADIGHYEFGDVHLPLLFPALKQMDEHNDPVTIDYWLAYWIAAFEHVLSHQSLRERIVFLSYEETCHAPARALAALCARLEIPEEGALPRAAAMFKDAPRSRTEDVDVDPALCARAGRIYDALMSERLS